MPFDHDHDPTSGHFDGCDDNDLVGGGGEIDAVELVQELVGTDEGSVVELGPADSRLVERSTEVQESIVSGNNPVGSVVEHPILEVDDTDDNAQNDCSDDSKEERDRNLDAWSSARGERLSAAVECGGGIGGKTHDLMSKLKYLGSNSR